ncbi:pyruvate dehydrogenase (acetyl-transferring) E1 component subunit alpha [Acaricomes phytoseiuli]|uniref:pyruvate dehydrogenase (acetyl-transferring) E1 component subunit alpha n=1 Tax=Acaricomes phytoseiuli TaxID=291968 RepID=UPI0012EAE649|nr:pyruvate dehydrogenase (acetyl-transferring) E1 component subunit alpha [Acaricomes phytoseiuli]MCW1250025.1 pyruvate dehydrogenase (acetyl-transferring) E1 component subunit alpha [Acaricomes phytoseiuli]
MLPTSEVMQFLDAQGRFDPSGSDVMQAFLGELDAERLREAYRGMALTRRFDQEATALQRQGELALWVPSLGQEAAQMGAVLAAEPQDYIFPTYREHAIAWYRGVTPGELLALFRGIAHGGWDPKSTRFHLYTLVLAAQTLHAVGYAMGIQRDQARGATEAAEAVLAFFGDGASSEGDVHESMVFASSFKAPVVFFCQNNHWAISVPSSVQSRVPLADRAKGYGFPSIRVDGNDLLAVYAATRWALDRARSGQGPVLIEAVTYRLGAHTTADDPTKYRSQAEEAHWQERDPLPRLAAFLRDQGYADAEFFAAVEQAGDELAGQFREATKTSAEADLRESFATVYGQAHPLVSEELAWLEQYEAGFLPEDTQEAR